MQIIVKKLENETHVYPMDNMFRPQTVEIFGNDINLIPTIKKYQKQGFNQGVFYVINDQIDYAGSGSYIKDVFNGF